MLLVCGRCGAEGFSEGAETPDGFGGLHHSRYMMRREWCRDAAGEIILGSLRDVGMEHRTVVDAFLCVDCSMNLEDFMGRHPVGKCAWVGGVADCP